MTLGVLVTFGQSMRAEVQQLSGKEIYLLSEPDISYEIVASVKTSPSLHLSLREVFTMSMSMTRQLNL